MKTKQVLNINRFPTDFTKINEQICKINEFLIIEQKYNTIHVKISYFYSCIWNKGYGYFS